MSFLEMDFDKTVQVFEEKYLYSKWKFNPADFEPICVKHGLKINQDIFIVERHKNSNRLYPNPLIFIETTTFKRVIEVEKSWLLRKYCQVYKTQHTPNRLGRLRYEFHTEKDLENLLKKLPKSTAMDRGNEK